MMKKKLSGLDCFRHCFKKVQKFLTEKVCFFTRYETKKVGFVLFNQRLHFHTPKVNIAYCLTCPGCNKKYICKTDHSLVTRLNAQGSTSFEVWTLWHCQLNEWSFINFSNMLFPHIFNPFCWRASWTLNSTQKRCLLWWQEKILLLFHLRLVLT